MARYYIVYEEHYIKIVLDRTWYVEVQGPKLNDVFVYEKNINLDNIIAAIQHIIED